MTEGYILTSGLATGLPEDLVREVASVLEWYVACVVEWYGCDQGELTSDAAARAILAARAYYERREARRRDHERRHAAASSEVRTILELAEARQRARARTALDEVL